MKVRVNGRELNERVEQLGQQEKQYFKAVKTTGFVIVGAIVFVCCFVLLDYFTDIRLDSGPNGIIDAFKSLR